jgi:hypothetical protein
MGVKEGEEIQTKGIDNLFNRIIAENFPNLEKERITQVWKLTEHQTVRTKRETHLDTSQSKHSAHRTKKEFGKQQKRKDKSYKGKPIRITADFSTQTLNTRRSWKDIIQALKESNCQPRLVYPAKLPS